MTAVALTLPEPPSANRWWRRAGTRMHLSPEARAYKAMVADWCTAMRVRPIPAPAPVSLELTWFRGRRSGDLDKRLGVLLDALQGSAYENDSQIVAIRATRVDRPGAPGVTVRVEAA